MFGNTTKLIATIESQAVTIEAQAKVIGDLSDRQTKAEQALEASARTNAKLTQRIVHIQEFLDRVGISLDAIEHGLWPTKAAALIKVSVEESDFENRVGDAANDTKAQIILAARQIAPKAT